jgi:nucleotide-binding universal stress UspA family protein
MSLKLERVLVATDFSRAGQRAVHVAAEWARHARAHLRIVHVTPPKRWLGGVWGIGSSDFDAIERHAANALKVVARAVNPEGLIELSTGVLCGAAAQSIDGAALDFRADLLVVGARGERDAEGLRVLGGTSSKLLATAQIPLLLVRRDRKDPLLGVVAAVDLSPRSQAVVEWADLAAASRHLYVYHVYDVPFATRLEAYGLAASAIDVYTEQARAQREADLTALVTSIGRAAVTTRVVERGDPAALLSRYLEAVRPSLVVLGKHVKIARSSPPSSVGSVCRYIASCVAADVLVV